MQTRKTRWALFPPAASAIRCRRQKTDVDAARVLTFACPDDDWAFTHTMALDPVCLGRWPELDICGPRLAASIAAVPQYINDALPLGKPDMVGLNIYNAAPAQMGENGPSYVERPPGTPIPP